ncbi:MAG: hypothetical protein JF614_19120 [Acidobacteria bacterium]|nr:hypothetical protein [Acidobacteriota bacterium]
MRPSVASLSLCGLLLCCPTLLLGQAAAPAPAAPATNPAVPESLTGSLAGRLAEQTATVSQSLDTALGDMQKKLGDDAKTWPEKVDAAAAEKVKSTLVTDWNQQADAITKSLEELLLPGDDKILKDLGLSPDLEGTLGRELRSSRADITNGVKNALGKGDEALSDLKTDQVRKDAVANLDKAFGNYKKQAKKEIVDKLKERTLNLVPLLANSTAAASAQARISENLAKEIEKDEFLKQYSSETGLSKVVRCSWTDAEHRLLCLPQGLLLAADDVSEIRIQDLPPGKIVKVRALTVAVSSSPDHSQDQAKKPKNSKKSTDTSTSGTTASSDSSEKMADANCIEGSTRKRLSCDQMTFNTNERTMIAIAVIKNRAFAPSYGGFRSDFDEAFKVLRGNGAERRPKLSLLVSGRTPEILLDVRIVGDAPLDTSAAEDPVPIKATAETVRSTSIPVAYKQWSFETGAFFALTSLTDQEIVKENVPATPATASTPAQPAQIKVIDKISTDKYTQETGIFLSVFSRDYPKVGFGLGFHTSSGRALSVYLGPTLRLRGLGEHALVTASAGLATIPVRRFPGIATGQSYPADSSALDGRVVFRNGGYVLINLGFSFGPIDNGGSTGK